MAVRLDKPTVTLLAALVGVGGGAEQRVAVGRLEAKVEALGARIDRLERSEDRGRQELGYAAP